MPVFPVKRPVIVPKLSYDVTGAFATFEDSTVKGTVVELSILVYSGTALVYLYGDPSGKGIELPSGSSFTFSMTSRGVWIKGVGGNTEVCVVASVANEV